jgi:chromosome segregation ATPase
MEVSSRDKQLRTLEAQMQEARAKSASQIGTLEEELIKRNQSIQKLHFELDSLKRKIQVLVEDNDRAKKREKDLQLSL